MYREVRIAAYKLIKLHHLIEKVIFALNSRLTELVDVATKIKAFEENNRTKILEELEKLINQTSKHTC